MSAAPVYLLVHGLGWGGMSQAVVTQAHMFASAGHPVTIVTFGHQTDTARIDELRAAGRLPADLRARNPHIELRAEWVSQETLPDPTGLSRVTAPGHLVERGQGAGSTFEHWYDSTGGYLAYVRRDEQGTVTQVNRFRDRVIHVSETWHAGRPAHVIERSEAGVVHREASLSQTGHVYLVRVADPGSGAGRGVVVLHPDQSEQLYGGIPAWHKAWLASVLAEAPDGAIVVANAPSTVAKLADAKAPHVVKLALLHNNQWAFPHLPGSPLRNDHLPVFARAPKLDALLVLTPPQAEHVREIVGDAVPVHVVPNAVPTPPAVAAEVDPRLVTIMSRLSPQKALHEAVHAFARVIAEVPDARLEIYGRGPARDELAALIADLGLDGAVVLAGRTEDPHGVMARSLCTVSTSNWEAMPLSIMESQAAGTPVVAYDCLYGPATLIEDGVTGRLVPRGDRARLAAAMVDLLRDPGAAAAMGARARRRTIERYSEDVVLRDWEKVFAAVGA